MSKQMGIIPLKGTISNITFYKSKAGHLARETAGLMLVVSQQIRRLSVPVKTDQKLAGLARLVNSCGQRSEPCF
jgi:hypothetical protein